MAKVTVELTDRADGSVNVVVDFGENGVKKDDLLTPAQQMALEVARLLATGEED